MLFADRSDRGKLRVGDERRAWFLDQILTQSIQDMEPESARCGPPHCARAMQAYIELLMTPDSLLLHFEPELREFVPEALQGYVFATRVTLDDVSDDYGLVLVAGEGWRDLADGTDSGVAHPTASLGFRPVTSGFA